MKAPELTGVFPRGEGKSLPKISVITPSYNQGEYLEQCIRSIIAQGYPNLEHIIIDGGSTDNSVDILKKYEKHLTYWVSEKDNGQSHAFNKGLEHATGEIIGWINSDDLYLNNCLFQGAEIFEGDPFCDIVFSNYYFIDERGVILKRRKEIPFNFEVYLWTEGCYHANCAGFFKKNVFDVIGGLDETLQFGMDTEFYLRADQARMSIKHDNAYWGAYRLHENSKSVSLNEFQKQDAVIIIAKYRPVGTPDYVVVIRRIFFKSLRLLKKLLRGSYLPYCKQKESLHDNYLVK